MNQQSRVIYLHGFASSPASRKANFFSGKLRSLGFRVDVPDLAAGDFAGLTITGQLRVIEQIAAGESVTLIGSSLGGYLAALYAADHPEVRQVALLAPAFGFRDLWAREMGEAGLQSWRETGSVLIYHYKEDRKMPLGYRFFEDAARYEPAPSFSQPALIFHGNQDLVVPVLHSEEYARDHPNARLTRFESGHELTGVLDLIWDQLWEFLQKRPSFEC